MADMFNAEIRVWDEFAPEKDATHVQVVEQGEFVDEALELALVELMSTTPELQFTVFKALNKAISAS